MCVTTTVYACSCIEYRRTATCASAQAPGIRRTPCKTHAASDSFGLQLHRRLRLDCASHHRHVQCYCGHRRSITHVWLLFNYAAPPRFHVTVCPDCVHYYDDTPFATPLTAERVGTVPACMVVDGRLCYLKV